MQQILARSRKRVRIVLPPKQYPDWIGEISGSYESSYDPTGPGTIFSARLGAILDVENSVITSMRKSAFFHGYDSHIVVYGNSRRMDLEDLAYYTTATEPL